MILTKTVKLICSQSNKKHLEAKGYKWGMNKSIEVNVHDLTPSSRSIVTIICDYCDVDSRTSNWEKTYGRVMLSRGNLTKDCCYNCRNKKMKETMLTKYGVENPSQIESVAKIIGDKVRTPFEKVKSDFLFKNLILISEDYKNGSEKLEFICDNHIDSGIQKISYHHLKHKIIHGCQFCVNEYHSKKMKEKKGRNDRSELVIFLRSCLNDWKKESLKRSNYQCVLTGAKDFDIHHLYSFNIIIDETFDELALPVYANIGQYSPLEIESIIDKMLEIHHRYPLGVCIKKEIHISFHAKYGKNVIPDDFVKFAVENFDVPPEFLNNLKSYDVKDRKILPYYPYKNNTDSRYIGVSKNGNRWQTSIMHLGVNTFVGSFEYEYDAAKSFNDKVRELRGPFATINLLDDSVLNDEYYCKKEFEKYFIPFSHGESSRFQFIHLHKSFGDRNDQYVARITLENGDRIIVGSFATEVETAHHYNIKAREIFGPDAKIHYLTDEEIAFAQYKMRFFDIRTDADTIYSCIVKSNLKWCCKFTHENDYHFVGQFDTESEAAYAYNYYVQLHNLNRLLNFITDDVFVDKSKVGQIIHSDKRYYYPHKTGGGSIYTNVKLENEKWSSRISRNGSYVHIGVYYTDREAAMAYNEYVLKNDLNQKLNLIVDFPILGKRPEYEGFYPHKTDGNTIYTHATKVKNRWVVIHGCKHIGSYKSDKEAAMAFNEYVSKKGIKSLLNRIVDPPEVFPVLYDETYYLHKTEGKTIYTSVDFVAKKWRSIIHLNDSMKVIGYFDTDRNAAIAFNEYVSKHKLKKKLNKII